MSVYFTKISTFSTESAYIWNKYLEQEARTWQWSYTSKLLKFNRTRLTVLCTIIYFRFLWSKVAEIFEQGDGSTSFIDGTTNYFGFMLPFFLNNLQVVLTRWTCSILESVLFFIFFGSVNGLLPVSNMDTKCLCFLFVFSQLVLRQLCFVSPMIFQINRPLSWHFFFFAILKRLYNKFHISHCRSIYLFPDFSVFQVTLTCVIPHRLTSFVSCISSALEPTLTCFMCGVPYPFTFFFSFIRATFDVSLTCFIWGVPDPFASFLAFLSASFEVASVLANSMTVTTKSLTMVLRAGVSIIWEGKCRLISSILKRIILFYSFFVFSGSTRSVNYISIVIEHY